jgi:hypothetical protein
MVDVFKNGWGMARSYAAHTKPFICIDTENRRIVVIFTLIEDMNARKEGVTNIVKNPLADLHPYCQ